VTTILCDLDGTLLVKVRPDPPGMVSPKRAAINRALAEVCDVPAVDFSQGLVHGLTDWQISERALQVCRPGARIDAETWRAVVARAAEVFTPAFADLAEPLYRPLPGVPAVLHALRAAGHRLGVATGNVSFFARFKIAQAGIDLAVFDGPSAFGDHGRERVEILRAALALGERSPTVVLGDTVWDRAGAAAAQLPFLATGAMGLAREQVHDEPVSAAAWVANLSDIDAVAAAVERLAAR